MPRPTSSETCVTCGGHRDDVGPLSRRGRCVPCGESASVENARQLAAHEGPYFDRWRAGVAASVGAYYAGIERREAARRARAAEGG